MFIEQYIDDKSNFTKFINCIIYIASSVWNSLCHYFAVNHDRLRNHTNDREAINHQAEKLLDHYGDNVLRLAYSYLHNMSDAEEILQETLIRFLKVMPSLESPSHEKAWLLKVAGNLSKNRIQYNKIRMTDELNETLSAESKLDLSFVWRAVKELPEKYREVIHLYYYEGYSTVQIAAIVGKNKSTIRSHLYRGRNQLKEVLKEGYDFEESV